VLTETRGLVQLIAAADRTDRAGLYRELGLSLRYEKEAPTERELVHAWLELCGRFGFQRGAPFAKVSTRCHVDRNVPHLPGVSGAPSGRSLAA
jgi:hypothetical protein